MFCSEFTYPADPTELFQIFDEIREIREGINWGLEIPEGYRHGRFVNRQDHADSGKPIDGYSFEVVASLPIMNVPLCLHPELIYKSSEVKSSDGENAGLFFVSSLRLWDGHLWDTFYHTERPTKTTETKKVFILKPELAYSSFHRHESEPEYHFSENLEFTTDDMDLIIVGARRFKVGLERVLKDPLFIGRKWIPELESGLE